MSRRAKFVPPLKKDPSANEQPSTSSATGAQLCRRNDSVSSTQQEEEVDPRLKNIDPKMIEMIQNEVWRMLCCKVPVVITLAPFSSPSDYGQWRADSMGRHCWSSTRQKEHPVGGWCHGEVFLMHNVAHLQGNGYLAHAKTVWWWLQSTRTIAVSLRLTHGCSKLQRYFHGSPSRTEGTSAVRTAGYVGERERERESPMNATLVFGTPPALQAQARL